MAVATIVTKVVHGPSGTPVYSDVEFPGKLHFNRQDDEGVGSPVPLLAVGTAYANYKSLRLYVTVAGTTSITNLAARLSGAPTAGLGIFILSTAPSAYTQCTGAGATAGNRPADNGTALDAPPAPDVPAGYAVLGTTPVVFDTTSYPTSGTGPVGKFLQLLGAVSKDYAGGAGNAIAAPNIIVSYDEA